MALKTWSSLIPQLSVCPYKFLLQNQSPSAKYRCCKMGICSFLSALIDIKRLPSPPTLAVYYSTLRLSQWRRRKQSKPFVPLSLSIAGWNTSRSPSALRVLMCRFYLKLSQGIWQKKNRKQSLNVLTQSHSRQRGRSAYRCRHVQLYFCYSWGLNVIDQYLCIRVALASKGTLEGASAHCLNRSGLHPNTAWCLVSHEFVLSALLKLVLEK